MNKIGKVFLIILLVSFLIRFGYVLHEYNHDCHEENCPICEIINNFNNDIRKIIPDNSIIYIIVNIFLIFVLSVVLKEFKLKKLTLTDLKVRLIN